MIQLKWRCENENELEAMKEKDPIYNLACLIRHLCGIVTPECPSHIMSKQNKGKFIFSPDLCQMREIWGLIQDVYRNSNNEDILPILIHYKASPTCAYSEIK